MNSRLKSIGDTNILLDQPHSGIYLYFVNNNLNNFFISRTVFTFHALYKMYINFNVIYTDISLN